MERSIHVHLTFAYGPRALRWRLVAALLFLSAGELASENVTLTTYYPAPSGVYTQMITTGQTLLARDGSGRVGIGLGAGGVPAYRLDVMGMSTGAPGDWATRIRNGATEARFADSGGNAAYFAATAGNSNGAYIASGGTGSGNYALSVYSGMPSTSRLYVRGDGNVGIGTTSPTEKLDVAGEIRTDGIKGAGCYNVSFSNTGLTSCTDTTNERVIAVNYDTASLFAVGGAGSGSGFVTTYGNVLYVPTSGTMMCCRIRP